MAEAIYELPRQESMGTNTDIWTSPTPQPTWKHGNTRRERSRLSWPRERSALGAARADAEDLAMGRVERRVESKEGRKTEEVWVLDTYVDSRMGV